jgi:hypothetical protein
MMTDSQKRAQAKYKEANRSKIAARQELYYAKNKEAAQEASRRWKEAHKDVIASQRQTPYGQYMVHKGNASGRGIEFLLTFEEWRTIWGDQYEGRGTGKLVMCRNKDQGAYETGNVRIDTQSNNAKEMHELNKE